ncbi:exosome complex exonuclease rrp45 [Rhizoctonia solani AG-1 IA]|uniref:Exosome complex exonuclease rrp45 n=1 Tax=Thanatephorus cucumeris (strain AG1-IA) TaxID=983506 RepID=L8WSN8_THACA|nr:exosome complex exonuclease rrp45 [Rhizoctonia solani AG-1 IA]
MTRIALDEAENFLWWVGGTAIAIMCHIVTRNNSNNPGEKAQQESKTFELSEQDKGSSSGQDGAAFVTATSPKNIVPRPNMPREVEPPTLQSDFVLTSLRASPPIRVDGRSPMQARDPELTFGDSLGWVECRMGKTSALANVSATMTRPRPDRPYEGTVTIHTELSPMAAAIYDAGRLFEGVRPLTEKLCVFSPDSRYAIDSPLLTLNPFGLGQKVWALRLTIHVLSDEGNMLDCACLAAVTALRHFRRPDVEVVGDEVIIVGIRFSHDPEERAPLPLSLHHTPYCVSFTFLDEDLPVLDPNHLETQISLSSLSLALTPARELCTVQKAGGLALDADEMLRLVDIAAGRAKELNSLVEKRLKEDLAMRVIEIR